ncbi:SDR family oxidoreductase [Streptomyces sp. NPDC049813]|uniref:SDR family oxidoreductase n=1 Tax=Streptomyces sp. NPDC049813 TaxID=3365597 RepID=UPI00379A0671
MTRYGGRRAMVVGGPAPTGLAIAKRLVEGGARVLVVAPASEHGRLGAELGTAARIVDPAALDALWDAEGPGPSVDWLFAATAALARPLLPRLRPGAAVVLTAAEPSGTEPHTLATDLADLGIRVNAVVPACIAASHEPPAPLPPLGRLGAAEEVARAALFLATDATFTTGARLPVDGGLGRGPASLPPPPTDSPVPPLDEPWSKQP